MYLYHSYLFQKGQDGKKDSEVAKSNSGTERPDSHQTERVDSGHEAEIK